MRPFTLSVGDSRIIRTVLLLSIVLLGGCSEFKADPAPNSDYLEHQSELKPSEDRAAFANRVWVKDKEKLYRERDKYTKIHFRPVRTDFLLKRGWWNDLNTADKAQYQKELQEMAAYTKATFDSTFSQDPKKRFAVVQTEGPHTLVYEFALVELVATKAHINALGTALGFIVPGGGIIKAAGSGSIAIEAKAFDGETKELLLEWADREKDQLAPVTINEYSWYSNAKKAVDSWAEELLEIYNTPSTHKVEDRPLVTINPF